MRRAQSSLLSFALLLLAATQPATAQQPLALRELPPPGKAALLVATADAYVGDILNDLANRSCHVESVAVIESGRWQVYIHGAPPAVNAAFPLLEAQQPFYVRCGPDSVTPLPGGVLSEITLDPGPRCVFAGTGATIAVEGQRVSFNCLTIPHGASIVLLGAPSVRGLSLTATKAFIFPEPGGVRLSGSSTETVRIEEVRLSDGTHCAFAGEGATLAFDGQRVN